MGSSHGIHVPKLGRGLAGLAWLAANHELTYKRKTSNLRVVVHDIGRSGIFYQPSSWSIIRLILRPEFS